jgi:hypothetical protein
MHHEYPTDSTRWIHAESCKRNRSDALPENGTLYAPVVLLGRSKTRPTSGGACFPGAHGRAGFKNPAAYDIPSTGRRSGATKNKGAGAGDRTSRGEACRRCRVRHDCHS